MSEQALTKEQIKAQKELEKAQKAEEKRLQRNAELEKKQKEREAERAVKAEEKRVQREATAAARAEKQKVEAEKRAEAVKQRAIERAEKAAERDAGSKRAKEEAKAAREAAIVARREAIAKRRSEIKGDVRRPRSTHVLVRPATEGLSQPKTFSTRYHVFAKVKELAAETTADENGNVLLDIADIQAACNGFMYGESVRSYLSKLEEMDHLSLLHIEPEKATA